MKRTSLALFSLALAGSASAQDTEPRTWRGSETPDYEVVREFMPGVEVRDYPEMIMAAVTVEGSKGQASNRAFDKLAGYIFGGNSGDQKIAMTSPVLSKPARMIQYTSTPVMDEASPESSTTWTQAFILPSEYALSDLPAPRDGSVRIFTAQPYRVASVAFQGLGSRSQFSQAREILTRVLADEGIEHSPVPEYASYDAPWVPASEKRHEVHFRLED